MSEDREFGPGFKLTQEDYENFLFHWFEWVAISALETDAVLNSDVVGSYKIGNYAPDSADDKSVYLNPLKTSADSSKTVRKVSQISFYIDERTPKDHLLGSIGEVLLYPKMTGPF